MLPLPLNFDENEWFIILNLLLGVIVVYILPKRFATVITILIMLFSMSIAKIIDHAIAGEPLDLYDIGDQKKYELWDVIGYFMYLPYAYLSIYLYDKLNPKGIFLSVYIILMSLSGIIFEWIAIKFHVFKYEKWTLFYSFSVYLAVSIVHILFFNFLKKYLKNNRSIQKKGT